MTLMIVKILEHPLKSSPNKYRGDNIFAIDLDGQFWLALLPFTLYLKVKVASQVAGSLEYRWSRV